MNNVVKAFGANRFGGYLVLWGTRDQKDVTGEYFTAKTAEMKSIFDALGKLPVLYHHAADASLKSEVIGVIDMMQPDEVGLWVEAQATKADLYRRMVKPLLDQNLLGWSSGTFPRAKEMKSGGEITRWPIMEGSLTPTPADPRQLMRPVSAVKAAFEELGLDVGALKGYDDPTTAPDTDESTALILERERLALLELSSQFAETIEKAGTFDESKHPRFPKGHPLAGQFMPKYMWNTAKLAEFWKGKSAVEAIREFQFSNLGSTPHNHMRQFATAWHRGNSSAVDLTFNRIVQDVRSASSPDRTAEGIDLESVNRFAKTDVVQMSLDSFLDSYQAPPRYKQALVGNTAMLRSMANLLTEIGRGR